MSEKHTDPALITSSDGAFSGIEQLDLRGTPCPINFVRTKLRLEKMPSGSRLQVWLDGGEPIEQVPDSLRMEGYGIEQIQDCSDYFILHVRKPD